MKSLILLLIVLTLGTYVRAQTLDTVRVINKAKKFTPRDHIMLMFEVIDTVNASGKKSTMSRSYYFDEPNRRLKSIREYYNPKKPDKGIQVIYSFALNKLTAVTVIPSKSTCKNCASRYFYSNDSLSSKEENSFTKADPGIFLQQALYFQSKLPQDLTWGYFDDEVIVNGIRKKVRKSY